MSADQELVRKLRVQVAERLNEQRRRDQVNGVPPMSAEDEREYARSLIVQVLEDHARYELAEGRTPPTPDDDAQIAGAIHSALFGVGRLQPLIDDPEVENIDINGYDQVFVQYGDGREENPGPVAESDEELVELIQVLAAHAGLTSRPFDSASRSSTCDFRTAPGCPPSWVSPRARRCRSGRPAWARCSSDLVANGTMSDDVGSFLRSAVAAARTS